MEWVKMNDSWPYIGQKVILLSNHVVQEETYTFDCYDISDGICGYFWDRDDIDEGVDIDDSQQWQPLPDPPS